MQDPDHQKFIIDASLRPPPQLGLDEAAHPFEGGVQPSQEALRHQNYRYTESQQHLQSVPLPPDSSTPPERSALIPNYSAATNSTNSTTNLRSRNRGQLEPFKIDEPPPHPLSPRHPTPPQRILGLTTFVFWGLLVVLVLLVSVGIAIGLALGLRQHSTPTTSTPTATNQEGVVSPAPTNPYCPSQNGATITPYDASGTSIRFSTDVTQSFEVQCNTQYAAGAALGNPGVRDIMLMSAPDLVSCVALCAQYNSGYSYAITDDVDVGGGLCVAVTLIKAPAEFCYLKNATGDNDTGTNIPAGVGVDSAVLIGDYSTMSEAQLWSMFGGSERTFGQGSNGTNGTFSNR